MLPVDSGTTAYPRRPQCVHLSNSGPKVLTRTDQESFTKLRPCGESTRNRAFEKQEEGWFISKQMRNLPYPSGLLGTQPVSHRGSLATNEVDDTTHCALDPVQLWPCAVDAGMHVAVMGLGRSAEPRVGIGALRAVAGSHKNGDLWRDRTKFDGCNGRRTCNGSATCRRCRVYRSAGVDRVPIPDPRGRSMSL